MLLLFLCWFFYVVPGLLRNFLRYPEYPVVHSCLLILFYAAIVTVDFVFGT